MVLLSYFNCAVGNVHFASFRFHLNWKIIARTFCSQKFGILFAAQDSGYQGLPGPARAGTARKNFSSRPNPAGAQANACYRAQPLPPRKHYGRLPSYANAPNCISQCSSSCGGVFVALLFCHVRFCRCAVPSLCFSVVCALDAVAFWRCALLSTAVLSRAFLTPFCFVGIPTHCTKHVLHSIYTKMRSSWSWQVI